MVSFIKAKVFHKRHRPQNIFCYNSGYISICLSEQQTKLPWFFSVDRFNLFCFYNKDHATRDGSLTIEWLYKNLDNVKIPREDISKVVLITHPRCLGFVFNPVSFYFCFNKNNQPIAVVAEVNNTFGQTHSYIITEQNTTPIIQNKTYRAEKEFFVSPFFKREGNYEFRFNYFEDKIAIFVDYFKDKELLFETSLTGRTVEFTAKNSFPYIFTTFKTVVLIVFQAFILKFFKKLKFRRPQKQLDKKITLNNL